MNQKISQLPISILTLNSIFPIVENGVTSRTTLADILSQSATVNKIVTGATYNQSNGVTTFYYNSGISFDVSGYFTGFTYTPESIGNKQLNMDYDGTGTKYPNVDAVNELTNTISLATINTGFVDPTDSFVMTRLDDHTMIVTASNKGIFFKSLLQVPPLAPSAAILNIPNVPIDLVTIPYSGLGITTDGTYIIFIGYNDNNQFVYSRATFKGSHSIVQLGLLIVKIISGVPTFLDSNRNVINIPAICSYSNLEITMLGLTSDVIVRPNSGTTVNNSNGSLKGISVNWHGTNNDKRDIASSNLTSFTHLSSGNALMPTPPPFITNVSTNQYWDSNTQTLVNLSTTSAATIQRWIVTINGNLSLQYGEVEYPNLQTAINSVGTATFMDVIPPDTYVEVERMISISGATDLSNPQEVVFVSTGSGGGSGSETNTTVWGTINGSINDQIDLINALNNKQDIVTNLITGTGLTNNIPKFDSFSSITNSNISDNGSAVTITSNVTITSGLTVTGITKTSQLDLLDTITTDYKHVTFNANNLRIVNDNLGITTNITLPFSATTIALPATSGMLALTSQVTNMVDSTITGTSFTISTDNTRYICTSASAVTATVASGITGNIEVLQYGSGQVLFSAGTGTTLRYSSFSTPATSEQYATVGLSKLVSLGEIRLFGETATI